MLQVIKLEVLKRLLNPLQIVQLHSCIVTVILVPLSSQEFGYPAMMIIRDALTDCPYVTTNYNHFNTPWGSLVDFSSGRSGQPWRYYYRMILNSNNTIIAVGDPEEATERTQHFYGNALVYRAMSYMDLMRMYEYKKTGGSTFGQRSRKS